jgi:hypothetical protein
MLPLGACWDGRCHAADGAPFLPSGSILRTLCNLGYARETCPQFPGGAAADAVRFTISQDDGGRRIRLFHVVERDHLPVSYGPLEYVSETQTVEGAAHAGIANQALAYVRSYLHYQTSQASR